MIRRSLLAHAETAMAMAMLIAVARSKGNTKVGACVYFRESGESFLGYNGFPSGIADDDFQWSNKDPNIGLTQHDLVIHAEANAVRKAIAAKGLSLKNALMAVTHRPCLACTKIALTAGIEAIYFAEDDLTMTTMRERNVCNKLAIWHNALLCQFSESQTSMARACLRCAGHIKEKA